MARDFSLSQLQYLIAVDKYRHFGQAAKACHVSQPTLSIQLSKLEDSLGVILFDRSKSPILPTQMGEDIIAQARKIHFEYNKIFQILDTNKDEVKGPFTLAIIPTISSYLMPLFIKKFCDNYPRVELKVAEYTTDEIIQLLLRDEVDGAILATPLYQNHFVEKLLYYEPFQLYLAADHPLLEKQQVRQKDLNIEQFWLLKEGHCFRNQTLNICQVGKHNTGPLPSLSFESGNFETLIHMVERNGGMTLLPQLMAETLSQQQKKFLRSFAGKMPSREISLVYSRSFLKEAIINALEGVIISSLPDSVKSHKGSIEVVDIDKKNRSTKS